MFLFQVARFYQPENVFLFHAPRSYHPVIVFLFQVPTFYHPVNVLLFQVTRSYHRQHFLDGSRKVRGTLSICVHCGKRIIHLGTAINITN